MTTLTHLYLTPEFTSHFAHWFFLAFYLTRHGIREVVMGKLRKARPEPQPQPNAFLRSNKMISSEQSRLLPKIT